MFEGFPKELDQPGYRWFVFFNHLYPSQADLERAAQQARLSKKETVLLSALKDIVQRLRNGLSAIPESLLLLKRGLTRSTSLLLFLAWFMKRNFFLVPNCTVKVLESVDNVRVPSISRQIRSIHPHEARKQMAFLFQISCYLELHLDLEAMDVQSLKKMLKESGFDSERELYGFPLKNPHN